MKPFSLSKLQKPDSPINGIGYTNIAQREPKSRWSQNFMSLLSLSNQSFFNLDIGRPLIMVAWFLFICVFFRPVINPAVYEVFTVVLLIALNLPTLSRRLIKPNRVAISSLGVELYRSFATFDHRQLLEWHEIRQIEVLPAESLKNQRNLVIWKMRSQLDGNNYSLPMLEFNPAQWQLLMEGLHSHLPPQAMGTQLRLELEHLFVKPIAETIPESPLEVKPISYTQIWLESLHGAKSRVSTDDLQKGKMLSDGRFEILSKLGSGGQGSVYLATERGLSCVSGSERLVALKEFILPEHAGHGAVQRMLSDLESEASLMDRLRHGGIVKLIDSFIEDWRAYFVLEHLNGESLRSLVERTGNLPEKAVIPIALRMCDILSFLHTLTPPVVHRDFTPENLMLCQKSEVKLIDFNVALQTEANSGARVVGKRAFIPPEQFRGEISAQSDLYALGGTLYFLLTGLDPAPLKQSHPASENPTVSDALDSIVAKATALSSSDRYQTAEEMSETLKVALEAQCNTKSGQSLIGLSD